MHKQIENIFLIGSSHIAKGSVDEIKDYFTAFDPDVVAIELDRGRLQGLMQKKRKTSWRAMFQVGFGGFFFALIAQIMGKRLARVVNTEPGVDMLAAARLAGKHKKRVILADQPIEKTLKGISNIKASKKWGMVWTTIKLVFDKKAKRMIKLSSLDKAPTELFVKQASGFLKKYYPALYKVLLEDRNIYITNSLLQYRKHFPEHKIMVVLGAAHVEGVLELLRAKII